VIQKIWSKDGIRVPIFGVLLCAVCCVLALWMNLPPRTVQAQAPQPIQQLLDIETFNLTWAHTTTTFPIHNIGQTAHTLTAVGYPKGAHGCTLQLQGAGDTFNWVTLAVIADPDISGPPYPATVGGYTSFASGAFSYYRIAANLETAACTGTETLFYTGYQFGPTILSGSENFPLSVSSPTSAYSHESDPLPYQVLGVDCYNPNGSTAYLQMFDANSTPTLGTAFSFQVGIPQTSTVYLPLNSITGLRHLYLGASTTAGGATAVSTALVCSVQVNRRGPFGSFAGY